MSITDPIVKPLEWLLDRLHEQGHLTYGWAIVVLTVIVRLAISPLYIRQIRSMRRMQAYAPEIKALNEKHKGDRAKQQEELMRFYKENEINPFSSCLPMLLQAPVFIGLFYALSNFADDVKRAEEAVAKGTEGAASALARFGDLSFMWAIEDISARVQEIGLGLIPLLFVYGLSQLLSFEVSSEYSTTPGKDRPALQKWLFRIMPVPITLFVLIYNLPAGLLVYWVATNLWTCGQAIVAKRILGPVQNLREEEGLAPKGGSGPRSSRTPPKPKDAKAPVSDVNGASDVAAEAPSPEAPSAETEPSTPESAAEAPPESAAPARARRPAAAKGNRPAPKGGQSGNRRRPPKKGGR